MERRKKAIGDGKARWQWSLHSGTDTGRDSYKRTFWLFKISFSHLNKNSIRCVINFCLKLPIPFERRAEGEREREGTAQCRFTELVAALVLLNRSDHDGKVFNSKWPIDNWICPVHRYRGSIVSSFSRFEGTAESPGHRFIDHIYIKAIVCKLNEHDNNTITATGNVEDDNRTERHAIEWEVVHNRPSWPQQWHFDHW